MGPIAAGRKHRLMDALRGILKHVAAMPHSRRWRRGAWAGPVLVATAIGAAFAGNFKAFWPFYIAILAAGFYSRFKDGIVKLASICGLLLIFAWVIFQAEQPIIVVAPFSAPSGQESSKLPFSGEAAAAAVIEGLDSIRDVAHGEPGRFPCPSSPPASDIGVVVDPVSFTASLDLHNLLLGAAGPEAAISQPKPEGTPELEVKGISLDALLSEARKLLHTERDISGALTSAGDGSFFVVARSDSGEGPWKAGPYPATMEGLQEAGCAMAKYIDANVDPILLGEAYVNDNAPDSAVILYSEQVSAQVEYKYDALMLIGAAEMEGKNYEDAIKSFQQAQNQSGHNQSAHEAMGLAYAGNGQYPEAFKEFDRALKCPPFFLPCPARAKNDYDRGIASFLKNDLSTAISEFNEALRVRPDFVEADVLLGAALEKTQRYDEAIAAYQAALNAKPAHPADIAVIELQLGNAFDSKHDATDALKAYGRTARHFFLMAGLQPENLKNNYMFAIMCLRIGTVQADNKLNDKGVAAFSAAVQVLTALIGKDREFPDAREYLANAHLLLGTVYFSSNDYKDAIPELDEAIRELSDASTYGPATDQSRALLGTALVLRGAIRFNSHQTQAAASDLTSAVNLLKEIPASAPQYTKAQQMLGVVQRIFGG